MGTSYFWYNDACIQGKKNSFKNEVNRSNWAKAKQCGLEQELEKPIGEAGASPYARAQMYKGTNGEVPVSLDTAPDTAQASQPARWSAV